VSDYEDLASEARYQALEEQENICNECGEVLGVNCNNANCTYWPSQEDTDK